MESPHICFSQLEPSVVSHWVDLIVKHWHKKGSFRFCYVNHKTDKKNILQSTAEQTQIHCVESGRGIADFNWGYSRVVERTLRISWLPLTLQWSPVMRGMTHPPLEVRLFIKLNSTANEIHLKFDVSTGTLQDEEKDFWWSSKIVSTYNIRKL